jgi:hypothetical protein
LTREEARGQEVWLPIDFNDAKRIITFVIKTVEGMRKESGLNLRGLISVAATVFSTIIVLQISAFAGSYLHTLAKATYAHIISMIEPSSGLPQDSFDAVLFDVFPQFACVRICPYVSKSDDANLQFWYCSSSGCRYKGSYGLKIAYDVSISKTWASYNIDPHSFDVSKANYLEAWIKGSQGGERFEIVLWSNCEGQWPGRPPSAEISVTNDWKKYRIPVADFKPYANLSALCRLSIGFNDAMHKKGTIYLDNVAFVDASGKYIHVPLDEMTNISNAGIYIASVIGALEMGIESSQNALSKLETTLKSIERFKKKSQGFPHNFNHVVSLEVGIVEEPQDRCRKDSSPHKEELCLFSTVDLGNLAAGLILLRQHFPSLAARATVLLDAMQWDWLFDKKKCLFYGCRSWDGDPSKWWYYDWLAVDSRMAYLIAIGTEKVPPECWSHLNNTKEVPWYSKLWHYEPGWDGGGLFNALLPGMFFNESKTTLGESARNFVDDQIGYYLKKLKAPAWGWSATVMPDGTYGGYGYIDTDVVVPHASLIAADCITDQELIKNLKALEKLGARRSAWDGMRKYDYGFRASVNWKTKELASKQLVLDQAMVILGLANHITKGRLRAIFHKDPIVQNAIRLINDY